MRIFSMTATFGKLEHAELTLKPGMNVIHAPNEWGKSTWCAFLLAMLYGLDTRAKTTRGSLADKEHFAPWSGSPMSGRMEIEWDGREITIERMTRGRIPMGYFRAYETKTGLEVDELNAANCGQMLLGVESSVFRRAGFIRLSDLPVTQDDALRRRLNALVTTGDESGDGARLEKGLRELKNRCRYNHSGLLPQAEQERADLQSRLQELEALNRQRDQLSSLLETNEEKRRALENHTAALAYADALADARRVAEAENEWDLCLARVEALENQCAQLPRREEAEHRCAELQAFREAVQSYQERKHALPLPPRMPGVPKPFLGMDSAQALEQAQMDADRMESLHGPGWWLMLLLAIPAFAGAGVLLYLQQMVFAGAAVALGIVLLCFGIFRRAGQKDTRDALAEKYGSEDPEDWRKLAMDYAEAMEDYAKAEAEDRRSRENLNAQRLRLKQRHTALCGEESPDQVLGKWQYVLRTRDALENARREAEQAESRVESLRAMARPIQQQPEADTLDFTREETSRLLRSVMEERQRMLSRLGEYRGRMEALGDAEQLRTRLYRLGDRIRKLEDTFEAVNLAQQTLAQSSAQLQRRFAPRISGRAQELMSKLTGGKYDRLVLGTDLTLQAGACREDTLHDAQWRSEGTIDQLYLTLRLAVAEELTPNAPLILDDALVRFDETRMRAALDILCNLAQNRQVILFTCQEREGKALESEG